MSKKEKLRQRLLAIPADFSWAELVSVLKGLGFDEIDDTGSSRRCFKSQSGKKIFLHEPHPGSIVKRYALRQVVESLEQYGINIEE